MLTNDDALADPSLPTFDEQRKMFIRALCVLFQVLIRRTHLNAPEALCPHIRAPPPPWLAVFSNARLKLNGEIETPSCMAADATRAKQPAALGDDIDVPFISCCEFPVHTGTHVTAAPGAETLTPAPPSGLGPRDDQV